MRKPHWWALALLTATLAAILSVATPVQSQRLVTPRQTVPALIARQTRIAEEDVVKVLEALGPVIREKLANGETIDLPGLGQFRVVRIPEHKDMAPGGRPITIAAVNNVEFLPVGDMVQAANAATAAPAVTVPQFEYNPLPDQTKGIRTPNVRAPSSRSP
jgi:nucleoid DNA-binding protein